MKRSKSITIFFMNTIRIFREDLLHTSNTVQFNIIGNAFIRSVSRFHFKPCSYEADKIARAETFLKSVRFQSQPCEMGQSNSVDDFLKHVDTLSYQERVSYACQKAKEMTPEKTRELVVALKQV